MENEIKEKPNAEQDINEKLYRDDNLEVTIF